MRRNSKIKRKIPLRSRLGNRSEIHMFKETIKQQPLKQREGNGSNTCGFIRQVNPFEACVFSGYIVKIQRPITVLDLTRLCV